MKAKCANCELGPKRRGLSLGPSVPCQEAVSIPRSNLSSMRLKDPKICNGIRNWRVSSYPNAECGHLWGRAL